jgi:thiamine-monophosphate kinase
MKRTLLKKSLPLSNLGELGLIKKLKTRCKDNAAGIIAGIGDDAAAIKSRKKNVLVTTDMMIEGIHFDLSYSTFFQLGHKFLAVNMSDVFAMGGKPEYFFTSIGIPEDYSTSTIEELYSGIMSLANIFKVRLIGGDTCASGKGLILSGTLLGYTDTVIKRSGAKPGDSIYVTDTLGDSSMGLRLLQSRKKKTRTLSPHNSKMKLMNKHLMPLPSPLKKKAGVHAMIDVSDGLLQDLSHICEESSVGAEIYQDAIPLSRELLEVSEKAGSNPYQYALQGGEDYCLLFTSLQRRKAGAYRIGEITKKGRFIIDKKGRKRIFKPKGYEHFKLQGSRGIGVKGSSD